MSNVYAFPKKKKEPTFEKKSFRKLEVLKDFFITSSAFLKSLLATTIEYCCLVILLLANHFKRPVMILGMAYVFYYVQYNYHHMLDGNYMYPICAFLTVIFVATSGYMALNLEKYHPFHRILNVGVMKR